VNPGHGEIGSSGRVASHRINHSQQYLSPSSAARDEVIRRFGSSIGLCSGSTVLIRADSSFFTQRIAENH
jgi:hypothetical protein